jgi:hypothetical protein
MIHLGGAGRAGDAVADAHAAPGKTPSATMAAPADILTTDARNMVLSMRSALPRDVERALRLRGGHAVPSG